MSESTESTRLDQTRHKYIDATQRAKDRYGPDSQAHLIALARCARFFERHHLDDPAQLYRREAHEIIARRSDDHPVTDTALMLAGPEGTDSLSPARFVAMSELGEPRRNWSFASGVRAELRCALAQARAGHAVEADLHVTYAYARLAFGAEQRPVCLRLLREVFETHAKLAGYFGGPGWDEFADIVGRIDWAAAPGNHGAGQTLPPSFIESLDAVLEQLALLIFDRPELDLARSHGS